MQFQDRPYYYETNDAAMKVVAALVKDDLITKVLPGLGSTVCFFAVKDTQLFTPEEPLYKLSIERWRG